METNNNFPQSNEECLRAFEQAMSEGQALSEAQKTHYNNTLIQYKHTQSTRPAPPILGAGGVKPKNMNYPHKQLTLKL